MKSSTTTIDNIPIHFGSVETRKLGERYAEEMLKLQGPAESR